MLLKLLVEFLPLPPLVNLLAQLVAWNYLNTLLESHKTQTYWKEEFDQLGKQLISHLLAKLRTQSLYQLRFVRR